MTKEQQLIDKLQRIEGLFAGATTPGERIAAANAHERIQHRLEALKQIDPPIEYKFTFSNSWSSRMFVALLRRYGVRPFRYYRQRRTTVMAEVPGRFVDETLWPEFEKLNETLSDYLDEVTNRVISEGIFADGSDVELRTETKQLPEE